MRTLLQISVADNGRIAVETDYHFPSKTYFKEWENGLYNLMAETLRHEGVNTLTAIQWLEAVRKEARYTSLGLHPEVERALLYWRRHKALAEGVPPYYILHQRVLLSIADQAPLTEEALLAVPGFGPGLLARYGNDILDLVRAHI